MTCRLTEQDNVQLGIIANNVCIEADLRPNDQGCQLTTVGCSRRHDCSLSSVTHGRQAFFKVAETRSYQRSNRFAF